MTVCRPPPSPLQPWAWGGGRVAGHLPRASARRLPMDSVEQVAFGGSGLRRNSAIAVGDDQARFGVKPGVQAPHPAESSRQVQPLRRPLPPASSGGLFRSGSGARGVSSATDPAAAVGWSGGRLLGQETRVRDQRARLGWQILRRLRDHMRMIQTEIAGFERFRGDRHPIRQRPADLHPLDTQASDSPDSCRTNACGRRGPMVASSPDRSARSTSRHVNRSAWTHPGQDLRQHFDRQSRRRVSTNSGRRVRRAA